MIPAQVVGNAVATHCHPSIHGHKLMVCRPLDPQGHPTGEPIVAIDLFGAGMHSKVFLSTDGIGARHLVHDEKSPVRHFIQGVIDESRGSSRKEGQE